MRRAKHRITDTHLTGLFLTPGVRAFIRRHEFAVSVYTGLTICLFMLGTALLIS